MHFLSVSVECDDVLVRVKLEAQNIELLGSVLDGTNLRLGKVSSAFATWSKKTRPEHVRPGRCGIVSELSGNNSLSSFFRFRRLARNHRLAHNRKQAHSSHYLLGGDCRKDRLLQRYLNTIKVRPIDRLSKTLDSWVRLLDTEIG